MYPHVAGFVKEYWPYAEYAQGRFGVPAHFMIAQAALETGWGRKVKGNNLFGIKAGGKWKGKTQTFMTTEFVGGNKVTQPLVFREYDSTQDSFNDYAALISSLPRYAEAMKNRDDYGKFADAIASAGYATDPQYAKKLRNVMSMVETARREQDG